MARNAHKNQTPVAKYGKGDLATRKANARKSAKPCPDNARHLGRVLRTLKMRGEG